MSAHRLYTPAALTQAFHTNPDAHNGSECGYPADHTHAALAPTRNQSFDLMSVSRPVHPRSVLRGSLHDGSGPCGLYASSAARTNHNRDVKGGAHLALQVEALRRLDLDSAYGAVIELPRALAASARMPTRNHDHLRWSR